MRLLHHLIAWGLQNLSKYDMRCDEGLCFVSIFIAQPVPLSSIFPEVQERGEMQVHYNFHSLNGIDAFPVLSSQTLGAFLVAENRCGDWYSIISCRKMGAKSLRTNHSMFWSLSICWLQLFAYFVVVVHLLSCVWFFATSWTAARQAPLSFTITWSLLKLMSIELELVMPSNHLILCRPLLLLPPIPPSSIRVFSKESSPCILWPKDWSFSFSISPSNEYSGLVAFRIDWFELLAVQGTLKSLL